MKRVATLLSVASLCAVLAAPSLAHDAVTAKLGTKVDNFSLQDFRGATHSLSDLKDAKIVVVAFLGVECPISKLYGPRLGRLANEYAAKGVKFIGVDSNRQDAVTEMGFYARDHQIDFPFLKDLNNKLADTMGAARVPQVFVLDAERVIRYAGRIDDEYGFDTGSGYAKTRVNSSDLTDAIDELLAGKPVSKPETTAIGCLIGRVREADEKSGVTYSKQIARIFQERCVDCHRPGQIGPFALESYEDAAGWAEMIAEVVRDRRMPPWHADPAIGKFRNDISLPEAEKEMIYKWVAAGAPQGNPQDAPAPRQFSGDWMIPGGPDAVIWMTENPVEVKAEGTEPYRNYTAETGFTEDKWIQCAEIRPGNRSVVHHIICFLSPPASGNNGRVGGGGAAGVGNHLTGFAPGTRPIVMAPGYAKLIPAGSRITFQMHYTPNGTATTDRSCIGLKFVDPSTVTHRVVTANALNAGFVIPAGDPNFRVESNREYRKDVLLMSVFPHMHVRGKDFNYQLTYPDGTQEMILSTPRYDFNWQTSYIFAEPKKIPAGTKLNCVAHYDNSDNNPANPDSTKPVRWGDQTWEEMMIGWFDIAVPKDENPNEVLGGGGFGRRASRGDNAE